MQIKIDVYEMQPDYIPGNRRGERYLNGHIPKLSATIQTDDKKALAAFLRALADTYDPKKPITRGGDLLWPGGVVPSQETSV